MKVALIILNVLIIVGCKKGPQASAPPRIISIQTATVPNERVSISYVDSVAHSIIPVQIRPWLIDNKPGDDYAYSIPTGNFLSRYIWDACSNGIRTFQLQFKNGSVTETHILFIDFKYLPQGGFEIPDAEIDGKALTSMPPSDTDAYGHYDTRFIYNR